MKTTKSLRKPKPPKAPRVPKYNMDRNYMQEADKQKKGPISRLHKKRLSK